MNGRRRFSDVTLWRKKDSRRSGLGVRLMLVIALCGATFTLVHEYRGGRLTLYHADLYRLEKAATAELGLEEMGVSDGVVAVEWPNRLTHGLPAALSVNIEVVDDTRRRITVGSW